MITNPEQLFGPEYAGAEQEVVAALLISDKPVDIVYKYGQMQMYLLPVGGYVIRYLEGSFAISNPPAQVVGGDCGMWVRWKSSISTQWNELPFPCEEIGKQQFIGSPQFHLEITRPHRIQLIPPESAHGSVKVRVLRYVSSAVQGNTQEVASEH